MWKCFNRGVRETLDRGVSVFKADTSNGTCLISSLAKDIDDLSSKSSIKLECSTSYEDHPRYTDAAVERNVHREHHPQVQIVNQQDVNPYGSSNDVPFHHDCHPKSVTGSPRTLGNSLVSSRGNEVCQSNDDCDRSSGIFTSYSCEECARTGKNDIKGSGWGKPSSQGAKWFSKTILHSESSHVLFETSKLKTHPLGASPLNTTEGSNQLIPLLPKSSEGQNLISSDVLSSLENDFSLLSGNHNFRRKIEPLESNESGQLKSNGKSSYCLLKLPFLCYDVGRFSSWDKFSVGWLVKSRSEFGKGNNGRSGGGKEGESEEAKEDAWRHYERHQSFLEAIGWSSALLFGWFFGQCRMRLMIGDAQNDHDLKQKRKCCIIGSMTKLIRSWKSDPCAPLKILPSEADGISQRRKRKNGVNAAENGIHESLVETEENIQFETNSSSNSFSHVKPEASTDQSNNFDHKITSVNTQRGNALPMPWYADVDENLTIGPITLDEAVKEAGKGLEEVQSEVLLVLALEKLDEDNVTSLDGPSAAELLHSAASFGNTAAAFNLGICYEKGVGGVVQNLVQAYNWYKQASDNGHAAATYNLAVFHANGLAGLHPNTYLANQLLLKASSLGQPEAVDALAFLSSLDTSESMYSSEDDSVPGNCDAISNQNKQESVITPEARTSSTLLSPLKVNGIRNQSASNVPYNNSLSENIAGSPIDRSLKVKSTSSEHSEESCRTPQLKLDHLFKSFGLPVNGNFDNGEEFLPDVLYDNIYKVKKSDMDSNSVQLLAH